jgi:uncharacterized phage protein (TIGR02218 family)
MFQRGQNELAANNERLLEGRKNTARERGFPDMITTNSDHLALLNTRQFAGTDLYEFTFIDNSVLRFAAGGLSVVWGGNTFSGVGPIFERGEVKRAAGLSADSLAINLFPRDDNQLLGLPWRAACANGALDGAQLTVWRAHSAQPGSPIVGVVRLFSGTVGEVEVTIGDGISVPVISKWAILDRKMPVSVYQPDCSHTIFSVGCGAVRSTYQISGTALSGSTSAVVSAALTADDGDYVGGEIRITSGPSAGARRTIKRHVGGLLTLTYPLSRGISPGDAFVLWPGCDGTYARCARFSNQARFNGQPFIPSPETAY